MKKGNWIIPFLYQYRWFCFLSILLGSLTLLFGSALMFTSGYLISKSATQPESILMVYVPIVGVRTFGIGRAVLSYLERLTGHSFILRILSQMRMRLYNVLEPQALSIRERFRTGDILGVLADDIEHLQNFYLKTLLPSIVSLIIYSIIISITGLFSIPFAILLAILIGLLVFVGPFISLFYIKAKNEELKKGKHQLYRQLTDTIFGISDWNFSGHYPVFIQHYGKQEDRLLQLEREKHYFVNWRDLFNQLVVGAIVIFSIYWANGMSLKGVIEPTFIAAFGLVMLSVLETFLPLAEAVSETTTYIDSVKRLDSIPVIQSKKDREVFDLSDQRDMSIYISNLTFGYPGDLLFNGMNLKIPQGEKIAIIGRSGSGKSTLLKLIYGAIMPGNGEVRIAGINTQELAGCMPNLISVLNQKPYLFNTSVLNNIRLGNSNATDEDVYAAAKKVRLGSMIQQLPLGYETIMQETGQRFSGGERQRIALARILLQNTPVVLLDEPTVGLDPKTEIELLETMFETLQGKTIIWVTHHLIGVEKMDRIIFLDQGKIVMEGNHQQLLEKESRYRRLYSLDRPLLG